MKRLVMKDQPVLVWCRQHCLPAVLGSLAAITLTLGLASRLRGGESRDDLARQASWQVPSPAEVRERLQQWLTGQPGAAEAQSRVDALWSAPAQPDQAAPDLLERVARSIAIVLPEVRPVVDVCSRPPTELAPPQFTLLSEERLPPFVRANLRLYAARWLAQYDHYDMVVGQLEGLQPTDVVDPAALLFYRGAAHHFLLQKEASLTSLKQLLENESQLPRRYVTLAQLLIADLEPLQSDSLDEVSRLMRDIQRRLDLAQAGKRVRQEEEDVMNKLDKMIKQLEEQKSKAAAAAAAANARAPSKPAEDSANLGGTGPGNVNPRDLGDTPGWGNLPPKQREETLQRISKELPAHYREVIEDYFRKLAREPR